jgi:transcriptional regulator with XRE-family HTH domain
MSELVEQVARTAMSAQSVTFGQAIAKARKAKGLSQKELAALVKKKEGGGPISPQYLNDIEHDRRSPTSDHLIKQFATILDEDAGYLFVLAGKIPDDVREKAKDRDKIVKSFANFIKNIFAEDARAALSVLEPRIEALERELAWQPIETAPKDGTRFLATDGVNVTVVEWKVYNGRWEKLTGWNHLYGARWNGPVAWRPLPPPPTGERG